MKLTSTEIENEAYKIIEELKEPTNSIVIFGYRMTKLSLAESAVKTLAQNIIEMERNI